MVLATCLTVQRQAKRARDPCVPFVKFGTARRMVDAARDEWSAMEAVVHLELLLEAEGLLIEERTTHASPPGQDRFRAA